VKPALALAPLLLAAAFASGCTSAVPHAPPVTTPASLALADSPAGQAIRAAVDAINATAGGPVAAQRAVLDRLVTSDQSADQRACPVATTTLAFDPAYRDMRLAAGGTDYLLPAYITIYTNGRITGSDLTTLRLWVTAGVARTAALCVS
jgi:hypothetical protein